MSPRASQVVTVLAPSGGGVGKVQISASKQVEEGARAMLIEAAGMFRLDVVAGEDMVRLVIRSLGEIPLVFGPPPERGRTEVQIHGDGEVALPSISRFDSTLALANRDGPVLARISIGSARVPERGLISFTAQAIVGADAIPRAPDANL